MSISDNVNKLLEYNNKVNYNLKGVKKMSNSGIRSVDNLEQLLNTIDKLYVSEIKKRVSNEKIKEFQKDKKHISLFKISSYLDRSDIPFFTFVITTIFAMGFARFAFNPYFLLNILTTISVLSFLSFVMALILNNINEKLLIKNMDKKLSGQGNDLDKIIREITLEIVNEIKNDKQYDTEKKETLISFLVEETYFLEKNKLSTLFKDIKIKILYSIGYIEKNKNKSFAAQKRLECKKVKNEETTLEGQLNFLTEKSNLEFTKKEN